MEVAEAADLIQRRQRSEFLCKFFECLFPMLDLNHLQYADPDAYSLLNSKYQGHPFSSYKGKC